MAAALAFAGAAPAQETTVRIGLVRSISNAANLWGIEKGYFREVGKIGQPVAPPAPAKKGKKK